MRVKRQRTKLGKIEVTKQDRANFLDIWDTVDYARRVTRAEKRVKAKLKKEAEAEAEADAEARAEAEADAQVDMELEGDAEPPVAGEATMDDSGNVADLAASEAIEEADGASGRVAATLRLAGYGPHLRPVRVAAHLSWRAGLLPLRP